MERCYAALSRKEASRELGADENTEVCERVGEAMAPTKSGRKRTPRRAVMPNFPIWHQKARRVPVLLAHSEQKNRDRPNLVNGCLHAPPDGDTMSKSEGSRMIDQRRAALKRLIDHHTAVVTASRAAARALLVREGIYKENGKLTAEYGGGDEAAEEEAAARA